MASALVPSTLVSEAARGARRHLLAALLNLLCGVWTTGLACAGYLVATTVAEVLVALVDPRLGVPAHVFILLALLLHGAKGSPAELRLYWSLTLCPLIRILSLSLPLTHFPFIWWFAVVSVPLLLAVAMVTRLLALAPSDIGLRWRLKDVPSMLLIGLVGLPLGVVEYLILHPAPLIPELSLQAIWLPALILLVSTGFMEEVIFRGLLQHTATEALGRLSGPLLATALFAVLHIGYKSWIDLFFVFFAGAIFAVLARRAGNIWGVTLAHGVVNTVLFLVGPFVFGGQV